ncbi:hypothetical protein L4C34_12495 [Vibrio profundum]|uniref:hypothetical protein n=1 Tax=Vibrio profundum TaxID=2910247 RepID=UPI003D14FA3E
MEYQKNAHGEIFFDESYLSRNILISKPIGIWNEEGASECIELIAQYLPKLSDKPWGSVVDMRGWETCTPEVMLMLDKAVLHFSQNNLAFEAVIPSMSLQKAIVTKYSEKVTERKLVTEYFSEQEDAINWLMIQLNSG